MSIRQDLDYFEDCDRRPKTRYENIKAMSVQDMAEAIAEIASDCRYCGDGCSDCDGSCLNCIEEKLKERI